MAIFYIVSPCNVKELTVLKGKVQEFHLPAILYGFRVEVMERKYSPIFLPLLSYSYHFPNCAQSLQQLCENQVCLFSSKSLSLNLYSHFQPFWMFLHTHCMYSKRSWITSHVPHSKDTGFLSASVQENNITNNTQLSRPHIVVAIWALNSFSRGCFLLLEKIIQPCFLLHRCWSSWIL